MMDRHFPFGLPAVSTVPTQLSHTHLQPLSKIHLIIENLQNSDSLSSIRSRHDEMNYQAINVQSRPVQDGSSTQAPDNKQSTKTHARVSPNQHAAQTPPTQDATDAAPPQVDGPGDHHIGTFSTHFSTMSTTQRHNTSANALPSNTRDHQIRTVDEALGLLLWCTSEGRLREDQAIALSDVGGSLKEVMLVALAAAVDERPREVVEGVVGSAAAAAVIEFWNEEYAVD